MNIIAFTIAVVLSSARHAHAGEYALSCPANLLTAGEAGVGILQLHDEDGPARLADPFVERDPGDGKVRVYGTSGDDYLEYPDEASFLYGGVPARVKIEYIHPHGESFHPDEMPWDLIPFRCPEQPEGLYLAGAMSPPPGETHAHWPWHNSGRRTYVFHRDRVSPQRLVRSEEPLFSDTEKHDWIGHNYGRDFLRDENGELIRNADGTFTMVYERVTRKIGGDKLVTELASRAIDCRTLRTGRERLLMPINDKNPFPATKRLDQHLLVEGPRLVRMEANGKAIYVMGFSSGDFPTDHYGINFAYSRSPDGPFLPLLTPDGKDLNDFARGLREKYGLSWGPARPYFYRAFDGRQWLVFHAVRKADYPGEDFSKWPADLGKFHRGIFMVPFELKLADDGAPEIHISEFKCGNP